jgi:hypothetical protein
MGNAKDRTKRDRRAKELECEMRGTGAARGGTNGCLKTIFFFKNQKHDPNIVEITHLCIMHEAHISLNELNLA